MFEMSKRTKAMLISIAGLLVVVFGLGIWLTQTGQNKIKAQNCLYATISGSVKDPDGRLLKNVPVISTSTGCDDVSKMSDSDGNFEIKAAFNTTTFAIRVSASKQITPTCSLSGYQDVNVEISVPNAEIITTPSQECPKWPFIY